MTDNYEKAQAQRIARDLHRTLRDHHAGVLGVDIPTSGIARALADHINPTSFLKPEPRGTMGAREQDYRRRSGAREALSDAEQLYAQAEFLVLSARSLAFHDDMHGDSTDERAEFAARLVRDIRQDLARIASLLPTSDTEENS
jgi:hypothetical protein